MTKSKAKVAVKEASKTAPKGISRAQAQIEKASPPAQIQKETSAQPAHYRIDIGISEGHRKTISAGLSKLLADTYTVYLMTHNFHWNVKGPMFQTLHLMFETQYNELALAVDLIAERIRSLGFAAPGTYAEFSKLTSIKEPASGDIAAKEMIRKLVEGQEAVIRTARSLFPAAEKVGDEATCDLLTQRIQLHEKTAWMLRSLLEE